MNRALEDVKIIGGRLVEFFDAFAGVEKQQSLERLTLQIDRDAANHLSLPNLLGCGGGEALNHLEDGSALDINGKR